MIKLFFIAYSILALLSCTKRSSVSESVSLNDDEILNHPFYAYNLKGDGLTDDTEGLQKLLNDSSQVFLQAGTYIINKTINLKANTKLFGQKGTIIKGGNSMVGTLLNNGRYFYAENADHSLIRNITFSPSESPFHFQEWNNACVYIQNTQGFEVRQCQFDFNLPYGKLGMEAVWVSGTSSRNNVIRQNNINTLGVRYAENGADSTLVDSNTLIKSYGNALTATGNHPSDRIVGCKVLKNTISNAGRMGIEDWGNTLGTLIQDNHISETGSDPKQAEDGIALSAVGIITAVVKNTITASKLYAIEVRGNYGVVVSGNDISSNPNSTGIILNYTFAVPEANLPVSKIENNKISDSKIGIHIFGDYESNARIVKNQLTDNTVKGISVESGAENYLLELENNTYQFSVPNTEDRFAIFTYTKHAPGTVNQLLQLKGDTIRFSKSAAEGRGVDFGLVIRTDKAKIENLNVEANNNRNANGIPVNAITAFGAKPLNAIFNNNVVLGGNIDLQGFVNPVLNGNNFQE